ncbi:MAG: phosphoglucosamine mutase [Armatimonadetes bacterium]|nr:phosphoglucosamine mutase [Armatimonadota bacterium]
MPGLQSLKIGISGVRGIVGESMTPQLVVGFAQAFGTYLGGGLVVIGRDTRPSGEMIRNALVGGLLATGCEVIDAGVCPVPTIRHAVVDLGADGGVAITASHNPAQWNALQFIRADGVFLNRYQAEELFNVYHQGAFDHQPATAMGRVGHDEGAVTRHLAKVLGAADRASITARAPVVALDACNGAGATCARRLLEKLGCEVIGVNDVPDGRFARGPEPVPGNLQALCRAVTENSADVGFALDPDADRLSVVSASGEAIGEEFTLPFVCDVIVPAREGPLVTNLSTSRMLDEVAVRYGREVIRTPVGEVNVLEAMMASGACAGGEGNGGVVDPQVGYCADSLIAMTRILEGMAQRDLTIEQWRDSFRPAAIIKEKVPCPAANIQEVLHALDRKYADQRLDRTEGIKVLWPDAWLHVRPSNTEPVIRVIAEADDETAARGIVDEAVAAVNEVIA